MFGHFNGRWPGTVVGFGGANTTIVRVEMDDRDIDGRPIQVSVPLDRLELMPTFKDFRTVFPVGITVTFWYDNGSADNGTVVDHVGDAVVLELSRGVTVTVPKSNLVTPREKKKPAFAEVMPTTRCKTSVALVPHGSRFSDESLIPKAQCVLCDAPLPEETVRAAYMGYVFLYCGWACRIIDERPEKVMLQLQEEMRK